MLKKDLIKAVAAEAGTTEQSARKILDAMDRVVRSAVARGQSVMLAGLGKLDLRRRGAKRARNLVTGEPVMVEPRIAVILKPSDGLLAAANGKS